MAARIEKVVVSGVFSLDGQDFDVDNNVWLVGDDDEVLVIDAPHDAAPIVEAIGGRKVAAIVLTHGHNDHITAAPALREATGAPIWFNSADRMLWDMTHADTEPYIRYLAPNDAARRRFVTGTVDMRGYLDWLDKNGYNLEMAVQ